MSRRLLPLLALAAFPLSACAQPGAQPGAEGVVRFRQPVGDGYEVRIRVAAEADCPPAEAPLLGADLDGTPFVAGPAAPDPCAAAAETLSLWRHGVPLDSVGGHRLWLGAPPDSLMWEGLAPEDHPVPEGAVQDLTGDGVPELVVGTWSGGAHCCMGYLVVSLGAAPRRLGVVDAADSELAVRDADGDGVPELWLHDFTFAYWNAAFAGSPAPGVALAWDGEAFAPSARHMKRPPLKPDALAALAARVRAEPTWKAGPFPPEAYWATLLDLLYAGRGADADAFAAAAWDGDALGRAVFLRWFSDHLRRSPYADAVVAMNADAVGWL